MLSLTARLRVIILSLAKYWQKQQSELKSTNHLFKFFSQPGKLSGPGPNLIAAAGHLTSWLGQGLQLIHHGKGGPS